MIIECVAPTRISLIGGGTDVPSYAFPYGGMVLSLAINLRQHIKIFTDDDMFQSGPNSFPGDADPTYLYEILKFCGVDGGHLTRLHSNFDGFIGCGLGSSSAAAVALFMGLNKRLHMGMDRSVIAERAWEIENKFRTTGRQDHYAAAYGGANILEFPKGTSIVNVVKLNMDSIASVLPWLHLYYIGGSHKKDQQKTFEELTREQIESLDRLKELTVGGIGYILKGDILRFAGVMDLAWKIKKKINPSVSSEKIDEFYEKGMKAGALAGKVLGAGGGGYFLFVVPGDKSLSFVQEMGQPIDFSLDYNGVEARIL